MIVKGNPFGELDARGDGTGSIVAELRRLQMENEQLRSQLAVAVTQIRQIAAAIQKARAAKASPKAGPRIPDAVLPAPKKAPITEQEARIAAFGLDDDEDFENEAD